MDQGRFSKKYITKQQKTLVDFISTKPEMYSGKFTPTFTRARCQALWSELATILNCMPDGANKPWEGWRKTWIDLKKNKKAKLATIRKYSQGTGGGPLFPEETEKTYEDKIFDMLNPVAVEGNEEVPEPLLLDESLEENAGTAKLRIPDMENIPMYPQPSSSQTNTPSSSLSKRFVEPQKKFRKVTKTARFQESIKNHSKLVSISQQGVDETREYRAEKLKILRQHYENKETLQRQQNEILQKICNHVGRGPCIPKC